MKLKGKKKRKHDLPSLDFVTALSIEECRERLLLFEPQIDNAHLGTFDIDDEQHFTVEWLVVSLPRKDINLPMLKPQEDLLGSVKYEGNLSKTNNGTDVQVIPIPQKAVWPRIIKFFVLPASTVLIVLAVLSELDVIGGRSETYLGLFGILVICAIGGIRIVIEDDWDASILSRKIAREITDWLHSVLYMPPEKVFKNDEIKKEK